MNFDSQGNLLGLQSTLQANPYGLTEIEKGTPVKVDAIGRMDGGSVQSLTFSQGPLPIKNIKASPVTGTSGPTGLKIRTSFPDEKIEYGNFDEDDQNKWIFTENKPLVGFYGILSDTQKIDMLGFITLNVHC